MRVEAKTRLYPKATSAMTDPTVRPETRIWTRSVMGRSRSCAGAESCDEVSHGGECGAASMDLALLGQGPVRVLGALRAPALAEDGLHDVGLGPLVAGERGTHELGGTGRETGEIRGPLVAELVRRGGRRRAGLALEGDDDHVVGRLRDVPVGREAVGARREAQWARALDGLCQPQTVGGAGLLDALQQRVEAVGGRFLASGGQLVEILLHPSADGELGQIHEPADVPRRDRAGLGRVLRQVGPAVVAGAAR